MIRIEVSAMWIPRLLLGLCLLPLIVAADIDANHEAARLSVRGEARLMVPPDQVSVTLAVATEAKKTHKAIADNSKKMNAVIKALKSLGLTDKDYKTQHFQVQPLWSSRPKGAGSQWHPNIIAYRVNNRLHVTMRQLDQVGDLIASATAAGANQINAVYFGLSNPRAYREQAITQAMHNAQQDALVLVAASGNHIARIISLRLDNAAVSNGHFATKRHRMMAVSAEAASVPPIEAGDITVTASVSVTYELARSR
jgi:uncharacterized protein YggE